MFARKNKDKKTKSETVSDDSGQEINEKNKSILGRVKSSAAKVVKNAKDKAEEVKGSVVDKLTSSSSSSNIYEVDATPEQIKADNEARKQRLAEEKQRQKEEKKETKQKKEDLKNRLNEVKKAHKRGGSGTESSSSSGSSSPVMTRTPTRSSNEDALSSDSDSPSLVRGRVSVAPPNDTPPFITASASVPANSPPPPADAPAPLVSLARTPVPPPGDAPPPLATAPVKNDLTAAIVARQQQVLGLNGQAGAKPSATVQQLTQEKTALQAQIAGLKEQLDDLRNQSQRDQEKTKHQLEELERNFKESQNANESKQKLLNDAYVEKQKLESDLATKSQAVQQDLQKMRSLQEQIDALDKQNKELQVQLDKINQEAEAAKKADPSALLTDLERLKQQIEKLEREAQNDDSKREFATALRNQYYYIAANYDSSKSAQSLCTRTISFIDDFTDASKNREDALKSYENDAVKLSPGKIALRILALVVATAVGVIVGAAIGVGVGAVVGMLVGPGGGAAGALIGLFSGAKLGAEIAFAAVGAGAVGAAAGSVAGISLFKSDARINQTKAVIAAGKTHPQANNREDESVDRLDI